MDSDDRPDARFVLANERTFLAWIRTALALVAAGAAAVTLLDDFGPSWVRHTIGALLLGLGAFVAFSARRRWAAIDRSLRSGDPLPATKALSVLALVVGLCALVLLWYAIRG